MRKMKRKANVIRLLVLVIVLLVWYSNVRAQCYQNEDIKGEAGTLYERFCTGYWLAGTIDAHRATIFFKSRDRQLHICGLSDETHNLCTYLYDVEISEHKALLVISGETLTYSDIRYIHFMELDEFVEVKFYDENDKVLHESKNFIWYSY